MVRKYSKRNIKIIAETLKKIIFICQSLFSSFLSKIFLFNLNSTKLNQYIYFQLFLGVHGGGNSDCSSYIASFRSLDSQVQTLFSNAISSLTSIDPHEVFNLFVDSILTNGSDGISAADLEILAAFKASGDVATNCVVSYLTAP